MANELERFYSQLQRVCDQFLAVPRLPQRAEVLQRASELDKFCSDVDIQIAVNLAAGSSPVIGTKLRGLAEAAGLVLGSDGAYHLRDEAGCTLYTLANSEPVPFSPEQMRQLQSHGLVLSLDIPRTPNPAHTFDQMIQFAQHLADAFGAKLVDDNRVPLSDRSISLIRSQIYQFELQMERQSIPAGSPLALRLFA
jgi:FtsZ-interacting cell division protein ZipA